MFLRIKEKKKAPLEIIAKRPQSKIFTNALPFKLITRAHTYSQIYKCEEIERIYENKPIEMYRSCSLLWLHTSHSYIKCYFFSYKTIGMG